jgi:hypothetical protein
MEAPVMETAHHLLEDAVRRAVRIDAEALSFLSGVGLVVTTAAGQQSLPMSQPLSAQRVRQLHEACLAVAGRNDLRWLNYARYRVSFPSLGRFLCEYVERSRTSNLQLRRDPEAPRWVETRQTPKLPRWEALSLPRQSDPGLLSVRRQEQTSPEPLKIEDARMAIKASLSIIAAAMMLVGCASKAGPKPADTTARDETAAEYQHLVDNASQRRVCKRQAVLGTRVDSVVCFTEAELKAERERTADVMRDLQSNAPINRPADRAPPPPPSSPPRQQ